MLCLVVVVWGWFCGLVFFWVFVWAGGVLWGCVGLRWCLVVVSFGVVLWWMLFRGGFLFVLVVGFVGDAGFFFFVLCVVCVV